MKNRILVLVALVCFLSNIEGVYSNFKTYDSTWNNRTTDSSEMAWLQ